MVPKRTGRPWICLWTTIIDAEPFRGLSDGAGWLYVLLYALAGQEGTHGVLARDVSSLAWRLRQPERRLRKRLAELKDRGLVRSVDGSLLIAAWDDEQSRETEPERKRRERRELRARRRDAADDSSDQTIDESQTSLSDVRTLSGRRPDGVQVEGEGEIEEETEGDPSAALPLPSAWAPSPEHEDLANSLGVQVAEEASAFRDYAQANGRTATDWDAYFRSWLRKAKRFEAKSSSSPRRIARDDQRLGAPSGARARGWCERHPSIGLDGDGCSRCRLEQAA